MIDVVKTLQKLPERVLVGPSRAKELAINVGYCIHRGVPGYTPVPSLTDAIAARLNAQAGVTDAQIEAMQVGSMFGWHVPGADPDQYA